MQVSLERQPIENVDTGAVVVIVLQDQRQDRLGLGELFDSGEITGKAVRDDAAASRARRAGASAFWPWARGKPDKFGPAEMRRAMGAAVRHLKSKSITERRAGLDAAARRCRITSPPRWKAPSWAISKPDRYKTDKKDAKTGGTLHGGGRRGRSASGCGRRARTHHRRSAELHAGPGQ